jgi:hypothetical protein
MKDVDLYKMVKQALISAPACPDGTPANPSCVSCMAEMVTYRLIDWGHISVDEFTMSDPSAIV